MHDFEVHLEGERDRLAGMPRGVAEAVGSLSLDHAAELLPLLATRVDLGVLACRRGLEAQRR
jgi:hypothetical protein